MTNRARRRLPARHGQRGKGAAGHECGSTGGGAQREQLTPTGHGVEGYAVHARH